MRSRTAWQRTPGIARASLSNAWEAGVPPLASALHARWWQIEAWLRSLVQIEMCARDGPRWTAALPARTLKRASEDAQQSYMAGPEAWASYVVSYLDVFDLFD